MKSPFPGMDPYIEACGLWEDFHKHLIEQIAWQLADSTPERYIVRTGERFYLVLVESEGKTAHPFLPDVSVTTPRGRKKGSKKGGAALAESAITEEPRILRAFIEEEHRETFVEIYETAPERRLVTTIEVLSPSNKRPGTEGWDLYQRKRQSLLLDRVNLVEIDLLRGGQRMPMLDAWPDSPFILMVARARKPHACLVWEGHFQHPLPAIPIPLTKPDPDMSLSLQPLLDTIYQRFRYAQSIDYAVELTPPMNTEESAWCRQRLQTPPVE
ncbi:MAG TPA: DUF4058 family protein [Gemmataceae bacterium]|nr:DUF4058 family protein [Gemmataceae bacterium]